MSRKVQSQEDANEWAMLVRFEGETITEHWRLDKPLVRIGRLANNDIVIDDRWVSRFHADIRRDGTQYFLRDLNSKNGTLINGRRLNGEHRLIDGDQVGVAPLHILTFVDYAATAPLPGQSRKAPLELDPHTREVQVWGTRLDPPLSQIQYDFLALLASDPGRAFDRDALITAIWPTEDLDAISDDAINALVYRLRQRLHELEPGHEFIATVRGYGFRLELPGT